ncbi:pyridoxal phosphate-dependent aminotransferase [Streptomyces sp. HUAS TT3]|uniref:pyridoxal phosphate-dependent aminotransferase n=1 Tax=unclassified Streptomyces TaxID=2593676 RepID=UPI0033F2236C
MSTTASPAATGAGPARLHLSENPFGCSPAALRAAREALDPTARYPDPARTDVAAAIAVHAGVDRTQVAVANGSDELVLLAALALGDRDRPGVTTAGTFPGYRICLDTVGRGCEEVPLDGGRTDAGAVAAAMDGAGIAYLCHPHNPSGAVLDRAAFDLLVERAAATGTPLVVDEAYLEFAPAGTPQVLDYLDGGAPLLSLRTLSKAYGLAALRIGYAVGRADLVARLHAVQGTMPFSVNAVAQAAAVAALADRDHLADVVRRNDRRRDWFRDELRRRGRQSLPTTTNFVAVPVSDPAAAERLLAEEHGILVRDAGRFGFAGHLRISLGPEDALVRVLDALDVIDPVGAPAEDPRPFAAAGAPSAR